VAVAAAAETLLDTAAACLWSVIKKRRILMIRDRLLKLLLL
jgi:hypothetical protein